MANTQNGKILFKYYKKLFSSFEKSLAETSINKDAGSIHCLRKDIKRLRSFNQFMEKFNQNGFGSQRNYELLKELFKKTGLIREMQLNSAYIDNYKLPAAAVIPYKKYLNNDIHKLKDETQLLILNFDFMGLYDSKEEIRKLSHEINSSSVRNEIIKFIIKESEKIKIALAQNHTPNSIHEIRKHFKFLFIIMQLLYVTKHVKYLKKVLRILQVTEDEAGKWHDKIVLYKSIDSFLKLNKPEANGKYKLLKNLSRNIKAESADSLENIISSINFALTNIKY